MKKENLKLPYSSPTLTVCRVELEQMIAASVTVNPAAIPGTEGVEDYTDGGSEWTSGDIAF